MKYSAKEHYQHKGVVEAYDRKRFTGLRGRIVMAREERIVTQCLGHLSSGDSALDVPSGTGRFAKMLVEHGLKTSCGDISEAMLETTRNLMGKHPNAGEIRRVDIEKMPFENSSFDLVFVFRLFQHLPLDIKVKVCKEIARVAKKFALISYSDTLSLSYIWRSVYHKAIRKERHPIPKREMVAVCREVGLEPIECHSLLPFVAGERVFFLRKVSA